LVAVPFGRARSAGNAMIVFGRNEDIAVERADLGKIKDNEAFMKEVSAASQCADEPIERQLISSSWNAFLTTSLTSIHQGYLHFTCTFA